MSKSSLDVTENWCGKGKNEELIPAMNEKKTKKSKTDNVHAISSIN